MIYGADTSMLVRLLTGEPADLCVRAKQRLLKERQAGNDVVATDLAILEAYFALKVHYGHEPGDIRAALAAMLSSGLVRPEPDSGALAALAHAPGPSGFADRLIHERHRRLGATTLTFDVGQGKLAGAELLGPKRAKR